MDFYMHKLLSIATRNKALFTIVVVIFFCMSTFTVFASPGDRDAAFDAGTGANGVVRSFVLMPDSSIFIGGEFTTYKGSSMKYIGKINNIGTIDGGFSSGTGPNAMVLSSKLLSTGNILLGGEFTSYNGTASSGVVLIQPNGTRDASFSVGAGAVGAGAGNNRVYSIIEQSDGKIVIAGFFTSYNGVSRNRIARLNADGTLDTSFTPGLGANNNVYTAILQSDGKIIIGGDFTSYNGVSRNRIARINTDGTLDTSFNPGAGADNTVFTTAIQSDGKIIIGGNFINYNSTSRNRIARLNTDGTLDISYTIGSGFNNTARSFTLLPNDKLIVGGFFTSYNGVSRNRIARLNTDGTLDTSFNPGLGANNNVYSTATPGDGSIMIGGIFTSYNGVSSNSIVRLDSSALDQTPPTATFTTASFFSQTTNRVIQFSIADNGTNPSGISTLPTVTSSIDGVITPVCTPGLPLASSTSAVCQITIVGEGVHSITLSVSDANGNITTLSSTVESKVYAIDTTLPIIPDIVVDPTVSGNLNTPDLIVCPTDNVGIASVSYIVSIGGVPGPSTAMTACTTTAIVADYTKINSVQVTVTDLAGNSSVATTRFYPYVTFQIADDITRSASPVTFDQISANNVNTIVITGPNGISAASATFTPDTTGLPVSTTLSCDQTLPFSTPTASNQTIGSDSVWQILCSIPNITQSGTLTVSTVSGAMTGLTASHYFIVEDIAPVVLIAQPTVQSASTITDSSIHIVDDSGFSSIDFTGSTAIHNYTLASCYSTVGHNPITLPTSITDITCNGTTISSSGTLQVNTTDRAGNTATDSASFVVDSIAPSVTVITNANPVNITPTTISFSVSDVGSGIQQISNISAIDSIDSPSVVCPGVTFPVLSAISINCNITVTTAGVHTIIFSVTDVVGNVSNSQLLTKEIDTTPATISSPTLYSNNIVPSIALNSNTMTIQFTSNQLLASPNVVLAGSTVTCATVSVANPYVYTCTTPASLFLVGTLFSSSSNVLASVSDPAGNITNFTNAISGTVTIVTDQQTTTVSTPTTVVSPNTSTGYYSRAGVAKNQEKNKNCAKLISIVKGVRFGAKNNIREVRTVEWFLNTYEGEALAVDGVYSERDRDAVIRWQERNTESILKPWGQTKGTGYVYKTSLKQMNQTQRQACTTQ